MKWLGHVVWKEAGLLVVHHWYTRTVVEKKSENGNSINGFDRSMTEVDEEGSSQSWDNNETAGTMNKGLERQITAS